MRADSAAKQAAVINYFQGDEIEFAIGADLDLVVLQEIGGIGGLQRRGYFNGLIAATVHCVNKTRRSFPLVVIRQPLAGASVCWRAGI